MVQNGVQSEKIARYWDIFAKILRGLFLLSFIEISLFLTLGCHETHLFRINTDSTFTLIFREDGFNFYKITD
jgi:hypothetical protein